MNFAARWIDQKLTKNKLKNRPKKRGTPSALGDQSRGTPSAQVAVVLGTFLAASWEALGGVMEASWAGKVANMAPTWPPKQSQHQLKIDPKIDQFSCASWKLFLEGFWWILDAKIKQS